MSVIYDNELQLSGIKITSKQEGINKKTGKEYLQYEIEMLLEPEQCPDCGSRQISKFGNFTRNLKDAPIFEKHVLLRVNMHRYRCTKCGRTFMEPLSFAGDRDKITYRLREQVQKNCLTRSITDLAKHYNLSVASISRIMEDWIRQKEATWKQRTPKVLGLADFKMGKTNMVLCVDMLKNGVVDMIEYTDSHDLAAKLQTAFDMRVIESVSINFVRRHADAVSEASVERINTAIDRYFVLERLNSAMRADLAGRAASLINLAIKSPGNIAGIEEDELRKKAKSDKALKDIVWVKNQIYAMYDCCSKDEAEAIFDGITSKTLKNYENLQKFFMLIRNYYDEVFAYFGTQKPFPKTITNYTNYIRSALRVSNNFSFRSLRARVLFAVKPIEDDQEVQTVVSMPAHRSAKTLFTIVPEGYQIITERASGYYVSLDDLLAQFDN